MKLVSFLIDDEDQLAILVDETLYPTIDLDEKLPDNMQDFLWEAEVVLDLAKGYDLKIKEDSSKFKGVPLDSVELLSPVPHPTSCRDAYAFRQHVEAARRNRGVEMIPEFDQFPVFYNTNHLAIDGPGDIVCMPDHFQKLDFELEIAIVIGQMGKNIPATEASDYIAGYMIYNDLSARVMQMEEMKLNLGPAKGKDFSNIFGPMMVTPDELEQYKVEPKDGHIGHNYDLDMKCWVNEKEVSQGNMKDMDWTFAEIIERCSYGIDLHPGDVIGSGTVGTGCFLELNGTGLRLNKNYEPQWLQNKDVVEMEITGLGRLKNTILMAETEYSILALKKDIAETN
ncbi:MAG: fumarylacetoacetate hydrolase family protein [Bacteroidetes bacterium]|nr:fumarylacetoacetate hydrolase family protein [Bacteroidota bacterium]